MILRQRGVLALLAPIALLVATAAAMPADEILRLEVERTDVAARPLGQELGNAPTLVTLWATYCAPCHAEVPALNRAARRWAKDGLRVVGVAVDTDDAEEVTRTAEEWGITYEVWWLPQRDRARAAELLPDGVPTSFLIGRDGVTRHDRMLTDGALELLVPPLLAAPSGTDSAFLRPDDRPGTCLVPRARSSLRGGAAS